jgi:cytochrome d ubiquinol oxidase subunit II
VFEFWGKGDSDRWQWRWEWAMVLSSGAAALLWGVGWANIVGGVPIDAEGEFTGTLFTLLNPYALVGGLATLTLFLVHGALFLSMRTTADLEERARAIGVRAAPVAAVVVTVFLIWTLARQDGLEIASAVCALAAVALAVAAVLLAGERPGRAFAATAGTTLLLFCALFVDLFPYAMVSSTNEAYSLTLNEAASSSYTLTVMTVVAVLLVPVVLLYQGWTYWVFRHRISAEEFGPVRSPIDLLPGGGGETDRGGAAGS